MWSHFIGFLLCMVRTDAASNGGSRERLWLPCQIPLTSRDLPEEHSRRRKRTANAESSDSDTQRAAAYRAWQPGRLAGQEPRPSRFALPRPRAEYNATRSLGSTLFRQRRFAHVGFALLPG